MFSLEFRSIFTKFRGNSWNSSQAYQVFTTEFPVSSMESVWISAVYHEMFSDWISLFDSFSVLKGMTSVLFWPFCLIG